MLLVLTNSRDETADYLCGRLQRSRLSVVRIDSDLVARQCTVEGDARGLVLTSENRRIRPSSVRVVWYRRPKAILLPPKGPSAQRRHAGEEWAAAMEGFLGLIPASRWMNHPTANAKASHKLEQLVHARKLGFRVPRTLVTQDPTAAKRFWRSCGGAVVVKPVSDGRLRGRPEHLIYTSRVRAVDLEHMTEVRWCPTLFQEQVPKRADVRVTVVGRDVHASAMVASNPTEVDIRRDGMRGVQYESIAVPTPVRRRIEALMSGYGLRFGALDFAIDQEGRWTFFELNPNGQWAWLDLAGGARIAESFVREFQDA